MRRVPEPTVHTSKPYTRRDWRMELFGNRLRSRRFRKYLAAAYERLAYADHPLMAMMVAA